MFKDMRRSDRIMAPEKIDEILNQGEYGHLAILLENDYPYSVPVNYVYNNGFIYIHCAGQGQKIEGIQHHEKVAFTIVNRSKVIADAFTTGYESVMVFGKASLLPPSEESIVILKTFIDKYSPDFKEAGYAYAEKGYAKTTIIKVAVESVTGKSNNK